MKASNQPEGIAMEPLRQPVNLSATPAAPQEATGNVFCDQLSRSQRQRGGPATTNTESALAFARQRDQGWSEPPSDEDEHHLRAGTSYHRPGAHAMAEQRSFA